MTVFHSAMASFLVCCKETCLFSSVDTDHVHFCVESLNGAHHFLEFVHGGRLQLGQSGGQLVSLSLLLWWNDPAGVFTNSANGGGWYITF